jgi:dTDP-4-amino-4,6-dideoxygalactose transaminase
LRHAYYKFYAFVEPSRLADGWDRDRIMTEVASAGVPCFTGSCSEIYFEKAFTDAGLGPSVRHPVAAELGETSLMFVVHPTLDPAALEATVDTVARVMERASL